MTATADFALDRGLVRRRFSRAATTYDDSAVLAREIARRMDERLEYIRIDPRRILDIGCGTGADLARLGERYPTATRYGIDFALPMLPRPDSSAGLLGRLLRADRNGPRWLGGDATALPLARGSVSLAWSNLMLNWLTDPLPALEEIHRILEVGGLMMFSTLGPDTLKELRDALPDRCGDRVHRFIDMHDIGDALVKAGFSDPVMDMEVIRMTYSSVDRLLADLKQSGCTNACTGRPRGLSGRSGWARAEQALESGRQHGGIPITFEVVQGHAWKAAPKTTEDGRAVVRFMDRPAGAR